MLQNSTEYQISFGFTLQIIRTFSRYNVIDFFSLYVMVVSSGEFEIFENKIKTSEIQNSKFVGTTDKKVDQKRLATIPKGFEGGVAFEIFAPIGSH